MYCIHTTGGGLHRNMSYFTNKTISVSNLIIHQFNEPSRMNSEYQKYLILCEYTTRTHIYVFNVNLFLSRSISRLLLVQ